MTGMKDWVKCSNVQRIGKVLSLFQKNPLPLALFLLCNICLKVLCDFEVTTILTFVKD